MLIRAVTSEQAKWAKNPARVATLGRGGREGTLDFGLNDFRSRAVRI